jgi:2-octaprenyl-6-methoxyphenol hydroxylase
VLEQCGVWDDLAKVACPIDDIKVADQHSPRILDFHSAALGHDPFGYIVDNVDFKNALFKRVHTLKNITLKCGVSVTQIAQERDAVSLVLDDGSQAEASLLIAADGRQSVCRKAAGIKTRNWDYNETALVVTIKHQHPHHNLAIENFYPGGPFAVLPMTDNRSGIVWTERPAAAKNLLEMPEDQFIALLKERGCDHLGKITLQSQRMLYPLKFMMADALHKDRTAIIGEAAHGMHPIAGQGFNLSVRDIAVLGDVIEEAYRTQVDIGSRILLQRYANGRHLDHLTFMMATDVLVKLFSNNIPPIRWARQFGLGLVQKAPFAKNFFGRVAMGLLN